MASDFTHESLFLENQLCFAFYAATRAIAKVYRNGLDPLDLTYPQYLVMLVLWEHDSLTLSTIGRRLRLDSGTLSPVLKRLAATGFVDRARSTHDEREVVISLTDKGRELKSELVGVRKEFECALDMSNDDVLRLRNEVMELLDRLEAFTRETTRDSSRGEPSNEEMMDVVPPVDASQKYF